MGRPSGETFRVHRIGRREHGRSRHHAFLAQAVMHVGGRQQAEAGMMVLGVIPGEETVTVRPSILDRAFQRWRNTRPG